MSSTSIYTSKKPAHNAKTYDQYKSDIEKLRKNDGYIINGFVGEWKGCDTKLIVTCPVHGIWDTTSCDGMRHACCPVCRKMNRSENKIKTAASEFIIKANAVHQGRYDYSKFIYTGFLKSGVIVCKMHGEFMQAPRLHLSGHNCPSCGAVASNALRTNECSVNFIQRARGVHDSRYDYSEFIYSKSHVPSTIICKTHGGFLQSPRNHLNGNGCPSCARYGFDPMKTGYIYIMKVISANDYNITFTGYGITNSPNRRISVHKRNLKNDNFYITNYKLFAHSSGRHVRDIEFTIQKTYPSLEGIPTEGFKTENSDIQQYEYISEFISDYSGCSPCLLNSDFKLVK